MRHDRFSKGGLVRYATEDLEIAGVRIEKGARIVGFLTPALRDPRAFGDADRFDPRRKYAENLNFSSGMHFCLGAMLARIEGEVAIGTLLDRYTDMRLIAEPAYARHPIFRRLVSLRVGVTPRGQQGQPQVVVHA